MSRSKREPWATDHGRKPRYGRIKRRASQAIRHLLKDEAPANDSGFKKYFDSWNISDWRFFIPANPKLKRK